MENKKTALEHKDGFVRGSDRTRGIVTGIREIPKGPERPKKSWGCNEHKKEFNKVQVSSGDRGLNGGAPNRREDRKTDWGNRCGLGKGSEGKRAVQSP